MSDNHFYEFGPFRLDTNKRLLYQAGEVVPLPPKVFDTLLVLVENNGRVLEKNELMRRLWPDTIVEEGNLTVAIHQLRKALGESPTAHQYIVTIPGCGYRFVANVKEAAENGAELILEEELSAQIVIEEEENGSTGASKRAREQQSEGAAGKEFFSPAPRLSRSPALLRLGALAALVIGLATALVYFVSSNQSEQAPTPPPVKSIAVLPFRSLNMHESDEYLGLGMADTLITKLSALRQLTVRPTSAVLRYAGTQPDSLAAGREQRVDAVLEGSIHWVGEKIRVTVRLLNVRDGTPLWAFKCDEEKCSDIFTVQDSISEEIARALVQTVTGAEQAQLTKHDTEDPEAYQAFFKGLYHLSRETAEDIKKARENFEQAITLDPSYALAWARLGNSYLSSIWLIPMDPREAVPKAKAALQKALEIDDTLAVAHNAMVGVYVAERDWTNYRKEIQRTIELDPNLAEAHVHNAYNLVGLGRFDEAWREIKLAEELDPLSLSIKGEIGNILYFSRRYDELIAYAPTLPEDPNCLPQVPLGLAYMQRGRYEEAIRAFEEANRILKGDWRRTVELASVYALAGKTSEAQKFLNELKARAKREYIPPSSFALVYTAFGKKEAAFRWLERAIDEREFFIGSLKVDPRFDPLRLDPRYATLLRRIGL